ncbi:CTO1 Cold tolerance protein 1 [Candida maltosa Xu316]|uniref:Uncharacterized protein n=1 Tax=Candida maltosa (strain Xu316) TaxID=1245528 RepID=M3IRA2_CANMX|nr:hypothetical protein G210_0279 [Candida maltosa Xu316]
MKRPKIIITDWDETVTKEDTIKYVSEVPYINNPQLTPPFSHFVDAYFANYSHYKKSFGDRNSIDDEVLFQQGTLAIESESIRNIEDSKIFKDLTESHFRNQASKIEIRPGFVEFVKECKTKEIPVVILSANWTSIVINQVLLNHGISVDEVITNELIFEDGVSTGDWHKGRRIRVTQDKLEVVKQYNGEDVMYVGDSGTDFLPLLHAGIPCAIENTKIVDIFNNLGLQEKLHVGGWHNFIDFIKE